MLRAAAFAPLRVAVRATLAAALALLLWNEPAAAATLTRGPYLQLLTTTSVTVVWNTDVPAACALSLGQLDDAPIVLPGHTGTVCAISVTDLTPGTQYAYVPLGDGVPLDEEWVFRTDDPTRPFAFLAIGDSGCGCLPQLALRDRMLATPADFAIHTGDMVYEDGEPENFNPTFFAPYRGLLGRMMFWPLVGNHDFHTGGGQPWRDAFYTPGNNAAGNEDYYSFDYGNAHFVVLDSNAPLGPGSPQYVFLDQDLAASTALWKFVTLHHAMYSSGPTGGNSTLRASLVPVFDRYQVDMVFAGHDHDYERTLPLRADAIVEPGQGTVYVTTGGGGKTLNLVGRSSFTAYSESAYHYTRVSVRGGTLLAQMIRDDGTVRDAVTLAKGEVPPPARCGDGLVNQPEERCDGPDHPACPAGCNADCTCAPTCGDGLLNQPSEACDGGDDNACPGVCLADCRCGGPSQIVTLAAVADTYIESGKQATWDHGIAEHVYSTSKPVDIAYLKFDLGAVTDPVRRATATLFCTNGSADGGTFYPVPETGWVEGDRTGSGSSSAGGPGLKWTDVDINSDGMIDARDEEGFPPDFSQPLTTLGSVVSGKSYNVDLTMGFRKGPGLYSVAIQNRSADKVAFASRENTHASQRPKLRLELGLRTCTADADCDEGVDCTLDRCDPGTGGCVHAPDDSHCDDFDPCTTDVCAAGRGCSHTETGACGAAYDLAPVADTYVEAGTQASWDHGAADHYDVDTAPIDVIYLKFDLTGVTGSVSSALLTLFCTNASNDGGTFYPVADSGWIEGTKTGSGSGSANGAGLKFNDIDTNRDGKIDARDTSPFVPDFTRPLASLGGVLLGQAYTVDLTAAFQDGPRVYTVAIRNNSSNGATYSSRERVAVAERPLLHVISR
jgi:acid phosphatase type 7